METRIQAAIQRVASKNKEAFEQFKEKLGENDVQFSDAGRFVEALGERIQNKQRQAIQEVSTNIKQFGEHVIVEQMGEKIRETQSEAIQEFAERWESGQIAQSNPEEQKQKKKMMPKFMQNLFTPEMFLKEIQFDAVFTFEKIALGILQLTKQKDPNIGLETQQPKKPRGATVAQSFANAVMNRQPRQPKKNRHNKTQTDLNLNNLNDPSQLGKSLDLNAQMSEYNQSSTIERNQDGKTAGRRRVESESKINPQLFSPVQDKGAVYRINKDSIRKHSVKREKEAESQMMANIDFLRNMRGSPHESHKKQWKQQTSQIKKTIEDVKETKRKQLESLGFTDSSKLLQSKLGSSSQTYSPQRADFLPDIRQSRKKGQIYKPAAFSVYTIQRDNEIFYNKFTK